MFDIKISVLDHPFKTSASFRGGVKNREKIDVTYQDHAIVKNIRIVDSSRGLKKNSLQETPYTE